MRIAGVDEAGRGPLAGPVVVAAVILDPDRPLTGLADSKILSPRRRIELDARIRAQALAFSVVTVAVAEIEASNVLAATLAGMRRALLALDPAAESALIDGDRLPPDPPCPARAIVRGDAQVAAIAAASILAKVERDRYMLDLHHRYPQYRFDVHKGYPTRLHLELLKRHGPCPAHRGGFAPVDRLRATDRVRGEPAPP
jgi:ribonuclease HII